MINKQVGISKSDFTSQSHILAGSIVNMLMDIMTISRSSKFGIKEYRRNNNKKFMWSYYKICSIHITTKVTEKDYKIIW